MKKLLTIMLLGLMVTINAFGFFGKKEDTLTKVMNEGKFIVGLDDTFAPMGFRNNSGEIIGFDIDLAKEVAKRMGVEAEFKACEWDGIIFELKSKKIDMVWNGMTITEKRKKQIAFSDSYFTSEQIAIVKAGSTINSINNLKGKTVAVQLGSSANIALESTNIFDDLKEVKKYSSNTDALLDLEAGRVDAVVVDSMVGRYYATKKEAKENKDIFSFVPESIANEYMGIGMRKEDETFIAEINKIMNEMKNDGTFNEIFKKWFGQ